MSELVVDTSAWIDFFSGQRLPSLEDALAHGSVVLSPVVVAELISGTRSPHERAAIVDLALDLVIHETPLMHWIRVGELRQNLLELGFSVSTPDAHLARCALDRHAFLLSRDRIFPKISEAIGLRLLTE